MTPFHPDLENDAGHSIDQDDLIAFHLHELSSPEERAVRRVLHTNPALQSESLAIASTLRAFPKHEPALPLDAAALDRHWQALRPSLIAYIPPAPTPFGLFKTQLQRWALPAAAAAVLATTALIVAFHHNPHPDPSAIAITTPPLAPTTSNPVSPLEGVPSVISVPTVYSVLPNSRDSAPSPKNPPPLTTASTPPNPSRTQTTSIDLPPQPITASPAQTSPATASVASNQQPASLASATARPSPRTRHPHTTDITLAVLGNLTPDRSFTSTDGTGSSTVTASYTQETTPSVGALASFHQQLRPWLGYRAAAAYSEPTFQYVYAAPPDGSAGNIVRQHAYEFSGTYVVQGPHHRRISTAAEAGAGLLALLPTNPDLTTLPVSNTFHPEGVFGVSAEFALSRHLAIHAGYRALLYKAPAAYPTYGATIPPAPNNLTLSNEPVIGLTYRFRPTREE